MLKKLFSSSKPQIDDYDSETFDILRLIRSENIGPRTFIELIKYFGTPKKALENIKDFANRGGKAKPIKICTKEEAEHELTLLKKNGSGLITYKSPYYPKLLLEIHDYPPLLTYKGNLELLKSKKIIAIVGSRNASINGRALASTVASELAEAEYVIASGLARGIDTAAHQSAIKSTIAVVAGGIDYIYPPENAKLYESIARDGIIIAELPIGSKPLGQHFPQRNRLISGLSLGVVIVEASLGSGSLITAKFALEQNREIFAVPGFPLDPRCQGTNKLIKQGAYLLESSKDILINLPSFDKVKITLEESKTKSNNDFTIPGLSYSEKVTSDMRKQIKDMLSATPLKMEEIIAGTDIPAALVHLIILEFELAGYVSRHPANKIAIIYT